jgi:hypothetical protein
MAAANETDPTDGARMNQVKNLRNVVGLPLWTAARLLARVGLDITHISVADLLPQCAECPLVVGSRVARG